MAYIVLPWNNKEGGEVYYGSILQRFKRFEISSTHIVHIKFKFLVALILFLFSRVLQLIPARYDFWSTYDSVYNIYAIECILTKDLLKANEF